tara:strand:- start:2764 stop:3078 length:315 start_codon:yes stop_codon:yes gene_type:complete
MNEEQTKMNKMKVTVRDVKVALAAAGFNISETFSNNAWNDKRKNGRRIKMPFRPRSVENISDKFIIAQNLLTVMFPLAQIELKEIQNRVRYNYTALAVYVTNKG